MSEEIDRESSGSNAGAVAGMEAKGSIDWPRLALNIGGVIDALMGLVFLVPALRVLIFGENTQFHTPQYERAMRLIASLGFAWTVLALEFLVISTYRLRVFLCSQNNLCKRPLEMRITDFIFATPNFLAH